MVVRILYLEQGLIHSLSSASCHLRISMSSVGQADEAGVHGLLWLPTGSCLQERLSAQAYIKEQVS